MDQKEKMKKELTMINASAIKEQIAEKHRHNSELNGRQDQMQFSQNYLKEYNKILSNQKSVGR